MIEENFKNLKEEEIKDIVSYIINYIQRDPGDRDKGRSSNIEIAIGCDSVNKKRRTIFNITIVFYDRMLHKGAHIIYKTVYEKRIRDLHTKLWREVEYVRELGEFLDEKLKDFYYIEHSKNRYDDSTPYRLPILHIDINPFAGNGKNKSNSIYHGSMGYLCSYGYKSEAKPYSYASNHAADFLCRRKRRRKLSDIIE
jgi:predicted RNase H-related nuclease YkuK (DUF458 family)